MRLFSTLVVIFTALNSHAYKILVYNSKYGHSHSNFLGKIADTLVEAGHNVTSLIPILDSTVRDGTEKSHKIYVQPDPEVEKWYEERSKSSINFFSNRLMNPIVPFFIGPMFGTTFSKTCKKVIEEPGLIERLRAEKYDVYISENFDVCGIGLAEAIKPKAVIGTSASALFAWQFQEFGVEMALSYRPAAIVSYLDVHSFFSRLKNVYGTWMGMSMFYFARRSVNQALKEAFGPEYPTIAEQSSNVAYVFTNSEPLLDFAAPTSSRVVDIPAIAGNAPKPLDEYWEGVMTRRSKTVLLSFGSLAKSVSIPDAMKMGIVRTIANFPDVTFIWKYEDPEDDFCKEHASKLPNLVLTKWMPQVDILRMGSTQETALRGVPGIFIPIFGDQPRNAGMMEYNGFGKVFDKFDLVDDEKLTAVIREVLVDKKYCDNAHRISAMLAKKPFSSKEQLIKTVEFAAEFGPSSALRPQSIDMSLVAYHNLDIILFFVFVTTVFTYFWVKVSCSLMRKLMQRKAKIE